MKQLLFLMMIFISSTIFSQNLVEKTFKTVSNTADTVVLKTTNAVNTIDTSSLYKTIYSDAKEGLKGLAGALKVGVEHVYTVLVKQQVVKSITNVIIYLLLLLGLFLNYKFLWNQIPSKAQRKQDREDLEDYFHIILPASVVSIILIVVSIITVAETLTTTVTGFVNPHYGAMEQIMTWVK